jgi:hypothetical protein
VVTPETRNYTHKESRASVDYEADLGEAHKHLVEQIFKAEFTDAHMFESVDAARLEPGLLAIFEPRIEQFSFASARETGWHVLRGDHPLPDRGFRTQRRTGRHAHAHGLWQRAGTQDRQRRGRAGDCRLRGDA